MTTAADNVKSFIEERLEEKNLKKMHIAQGAGVSTYTIHNIVGGKNQNISFKVILKLADYFKCSVDEVLGRGKFSTTKSTEYKSITLESSMKIIKEFIGVKMKDMSLDAYKFAENCGLGRNALRRFIMDDETHKTIEANKLLSIVNTFDISIDQLIGRTKTNPSLLKSKEKADSPSIKPEVSD